MLRSQARHLNMATEIAAVISEMRLVTIGTVRLFLASKISRREPLYCRLLDYESLTANSKGLLHCSQSHWRHGACDLKN